MKTSVNMVRKLGMFEIIQRTLDGYFEVNGLVHQWNNVKQNSRRRIDQFMNSPKTSEFIKQIEKEESLGSNLTNGDFQAVITIKGRMTKDGRNPDRVFMHPYLFIDFAMWLNPAFKYYVIKYVYDALMDYRKYAGDLYKGLSQAISRFTNVSYARVGKGLNYIVFGRHEKGIRNTATVEQLEELNDIQKQLAFSIDIGLISSFQELMNIMIKMYRKKEKFDLF